MGKPPGSLRRPLAQGRSCSRPSRVIDDLYAGGIELTFTPTTVPSPTQMIAAAIRLHVSSATPDEAMDAAEDALARLRMTGFQMRN